MKFFYWEKEPVFEGYVVDNIYDEDTVKLNIKGPMEAVYNEGVATMLERASLWGMDDSLKEVGLYRSPEIINEKISLVILRKGIPYRVISLLEILTD